MFYELSTINTGFFHNQAAAASQSQPTGWHPDLVALGYRDLLYVPAPAVQATIGCIADPEFHDFIQTSDKNAMANQDEEGVHAPLILSTLDLSHWTALMNAATTDPKLGITRLRQAHEVLHVLLDRDEQELAEAERNCRAVESYLRVANLHESWTKDEIPLPTVNLNSGSSRTSIVNVHPLLSRLNITPAHKTAIEDLSENIQNT